MENDSPENARGGFSQPEIHSNGMMSELPPTLRNLHQVGGKERAGGVEVSRGARACLGG